MCARIRSMCTALPEVLAAVSFQPAFGVVGAIAPS